MIYILSLFVYKIFIYFPSKLSLFITRIQLMRQEPETTATKMIANLWCLYIFFL